MIQPPAYGAPSKDTITNRLQSAEDAFCITPYPTGVAAGSIDLRLGSVFLSAERASLSLIEGNKPEQASRLFREVRIGPGGSFVMHPHQFVLACTYEYLAMPNDLVGIIQSRSTYGRMGLIAATAAFVGPGFKGCPTLELVNLGEVAVELHPRQEFCQLVVLPAEPGPQHPSRYQCSTRPLFGFGARRPS